MKTFVRVLATASMLMAAGAVAQCAVHQQSRKRHRRQRRLGQVPGVGSRSSGDRLGHVGLMDGIEPEGRCRSRCNKVSNMKQRCSAGGALGRECVVQAKLCK